MSSEYKTVWISNLINYYHNFMSVDSFGWIGDQICMYTILSNLHKSTVFSEMDPSTASKLSL